MTGVDAVEIVSHKGQVVAVFGDTRFDKAPTNLALFAHTLSVGNLSVMAATPGLFVSFYYDPKKLGSRHVDGDSTLIAVPATC